MSKALARHGLLKHAKGRLTYAERFQGKRDKRFHVITGKIVASDYDRTPEDAPDDDDGLAEDAPDDDGAPERPKRSNRPGY